MPDIMACVAFAWTIISQSNLACEGQLDTQKYEKPSRRLIYDSHYLTGNPAISLTSRIADRDERQFRDCATWIPTTFLG